MRIVSSPMLRVASLALAPALAVSCLPHEMDFVWAAPEEAEPEELLEPGLAPDGLVGGLYDLGGRLGDDAVSEVADPDQEPGCVHPMDDCRAAYLEFVARASAHARPQTDAELMAWIDAQLETPSQEGPVSDGALADVVVDGLGVGFLLDELGRLPLQVRVYLQYLEHGYRARRLVLEDPWVGDFGALLVLPEGPGPHPVVLALHGHGTEAVDFLDAYGALDYIDAGFALLAVEHRMLYADEGETFVGRHLLQNGFTLAGLHVYETLRAHRYARWHPDLDPERVVLLGHSAGAGKVDLLIRLSDTFAAAVTDNTIDVRGEDVEFFHEGLLPALAPWQDLVNDFSTAPVPTLQTAYGYPEGPEPILDFLVEHTE